MTLLLSTLAAVAAAGGCAPADNDPVNGAAPGAALEEQGYQPAPELTGAAPGGGGRVMLAGEAGPGAVVRLATPAGEAVFATADAHGAWRVAIPASAAPRLFGLSMSDNGRVVQAMGYLFVTPDGVVARLLAGGGSEVLAARGPGLVALALDHDTQAATLSGVAGAGEAESLRVDGVERGQATTDAAGRFVLSVIGKPLSVGSHDFDLAGTRSEVRFSAGIDTPRPLASAPFAVSQLPQGWRVDWLTPGGGEQTTLVFDALAPAT
jgi:hypothetical protein